MIIFRSTGSPRGKLDLAFSSPSVGAKLILTFLWCNGVTVVKVVVVVVIWFELVVLACEEELVEANAVDLVVAYWYWY